MTDPKPPSDSEKPAKRDDWIEKMAKRTSGVGPPPSNKESQAEDRKEANRLWRLGAAGLQMAGTTALLGFIGYEIDAAKGWDGIATITLCSLAIVGSLYLVIKEAIKANK